MSDGVGDFMTLAKNKTHATLVVNGQQRTAS